MKKNHRLVIVVFLIFIYDIIWLAAMAQPTSKPKGWGAEQGNDIPILDKEQEKQLDTAQDMATNELMSAAHWLDSFFDDGRSVAEDNTTRATISLAMGYSRNDNFEIKPRLDLRLRLPQLSNQLNLLVSAAEDQDFNIVSDPITSRPAHTDADKRELTAGLRYFLQESKKYNIAVDTGASWDYLFAGLRFRWSQDFDQWHGRFTNRLRYYTDDGVENVMSYDLERQVTSNVLFRATTTVNLYESENGIPHSQFARLYHVMGPLQAISYEVGAFFDTDPSYKMTDTQFIVKYRQRFFRDWLVLEVSPRVTFPEDHDREANPGIVCKLEAAIGYRADEEGYKKIFH